MFPGRNQEDHILIKPLVIHVCIIYIEDLTRVLMFFFNLLIELRKRDKMRGLPSILSLFRNEFNNCNNTRARMLDYIHHMTLRIL